MEVELVEGIAGAIDDSIGRCDSSVRGPYLGDVQTEDAARSIHARRVDWGSVSVQDAPAQGEDGYVDPLVYGNPNRGIVPQPVAVSAASARQDPCEQPSVPKGRLHGDFYWALNEGGTASIVAYVGESDTPTVPEQIDGKAVTIIGNDAFRDNRELRAIDLPHTILRIADHAFDSCSSLEHVDLPSGLSHIGKLAFAKSGLVSLTLPSSVRVIGERAFLNCRKLERLDARFGLREIGEAAFAYSGLRSFEIPASVEKVGAGVFDQTPAQRQVEQGSIWVSAENPLFRMDAHGGLYRQSTFVELVGRPRLYEVESGTRVIASGAFRGNAVIESVSMPEGVIRIGDKAFKNCRGLVEIHLPETLESIGDGAFLDTAVVSLSLSANVVHIGKAALAVQGENPLLGHATLAHLELDPRNPTFYVESGVLCERGGEEGDTSIQYVGPEHIVSIPDHVTIIGAGTFAGVRTVDQLHVHDHLRRVSASAFIFYRNPTRIRVDFPVPIEGHAFVEYALPAHVLGSVSMSNMIGICKEGTRLDFAYYDSWVTHARDVDEFASCALVRLKDPIMMSEDVHNRYRGIIERKSRGICRHFADKGDMDALEFLVEHGLLTHDDLDLELQEATVEGRTQAIACLLELLHRQQNSSMTLDFSL